MADNGLRGRALLQKKKSSPSPVRSPSPSPSTSGTTSPATGLVFPPLCNCERSPRKSPFRMALDDDASAGGVYCFTIQNVGGCDPKQKCCDGKQGVSKVELDVVSACKDSVRNVTVDGKKWSYEFNTALSVIRITNLAKTAATAAGTEICIALAPKSQCPGLSQLCSAGAGLCKYALFNQDHFPFCQCQRNPRGSRLMTTASKNVTVVNGLTRICFNVALKDVCDQPNSKCCEFELYKMEFEADAACADALAYTTIDGAYKAKFFQTRPDPVLKVTNIDKPVNKVAGTEVCLFMRPQCNTLEKLCAFHDGTCTIVLFNKPGSSATSCCPLTTVGPL
ncbi:hypothetical protein HXX76_012601 [Chlamydomonas incerta]|uniref:Pherophorin domain-containing protein n=1 Tax=Chlamydomonas incerta TaxID=51695 RepID=A0A835VTC2_CHLIN|nr:hypothetical protein HXX76_012601 [Chlamydomonas incerta]|eukprot:KAG2427090.1 hypothetical protein HXX76_012601 [Chlamydomonas incerta]